jgi:hypothetical protein
MELRLMTKNCFSRDVNAYTPLLFAYIDADIQLEIFQIRWCCFHNPFISNLLTRIITWNYKTYVGSCCNHKFC